MSVYNILAGIYPTNNWSISTTNPIIAWTTLGAPTTQNFAIPSNSPSEAATFWYYALSPFTTWTSYGIVSVWHPAPVVFNGTLYAGYIESAAWTKGYNQYEHRFISSLFGTIITTETTAFNNFAFTGTLT